MSAESQDDSSLGASEQPAAVTNERRGDGRRRTYNRRSDDKGVSPPYYETFERIALALEHIEQVLRSRSVTLPEVDNRARADRI